MAQQEIFTSSTTWICPPNVTSVQIECYAGGGGGGANFSPNGTSPPGSGGGAGAGAYSKKNTFVVTPGNSYTVTVGQGGQGGFINNTPGFPTSPATDGGDSWFNSTATVLAKGGTKGVTTSGKSWGANGTGGLASAGVGDVKHSGGDGSTAVTSNSGAGGGGAGSTADGTAAVGSVPGTGGSVDGGNGGAATSGASTPGGDGASFGGGGGGGMGGSVSVLGGFGGNGAPGKVVLTYTATSIQLTSSDSSSLVESTRIRIPGTLAAPIITFRNPTTPWSLLSSIIYQQTSPGGNALPVLNNNDSDKLKFRIYNNFSLAANIADAMNVSITSYDGVGVHTASMPVASQKWIHVWEYGFGQSGSAPGLYTVAKDVDTTIGGSSTKYTIPYGSDGLAPATIRAGADSHGCGFVEIQTYIRVPAAQSGGAQTFAVSASFDWIS